MEICARNQPRGIVKGATLGTVIAEIVVDVSGLEIVAAITRRLADALGRQPGNSVTVALNATEVMVAQ